MLEVKLGKRYAKSILDLAREKGQMETVDKDFELIISVCESNPDFMRMLKSPLIYPDKKQKILNLIFGNSFSPITQHLIEIIVRKKREVYLYDIAYAFQGLYDIEQGIIRGSLTSAKPLTKSQRDKVKSIVEKDLKTQFIVEEKVDPELIGGFVLKVGDNLYDGSISTRLRKLSQEFDKNPYLKKV